jgi:hypothetical protein
VESLRQPDETDSEENPKLNDLQKQFLRIINGWFPWENCVVSKVPNVVKKRYKTNGEPSRAIDETVSRGPGFHLVALSLSHIETGKLNVRGSHSSIRSFA